jgi:hypothetical protein
MSLDRALAETVSASEKIETEDSPFGIPDVTSGYPLESEEREAIERVLRDDPVQQGPAAPGTQAKS